MAALEPRGKVAAGSDKVLMGELYVDLMEMESGR
jgi:hypothetical protein